MLAPYRRVLIKPGAWQFSASGVLARLPMSMVTISIVLLITAVYDSYALAGRVAAVFAVAQAVCAPQLAKLVDQFGQARIMRPSLGVALVALVALAVAAATLGPDLLLYVTGALGGATAGSMGAMVRARWSLVLDNPGQIHTAYSLESALDELVFVVGPVLATFLATSIHPLAGLLVGIAAAGGGGFWFLAQRATEPVPSGRRPKNERRSVMRSGGMIVITVVFAAVGVVFGASDVSTIAFAEERGAQAWAGVILGIFASGSLISGLLYGARHWVSALWKRFMVGIAALACGVSLFVLIDSLPTLAVVMFVVGFTISPTVITGNALVQTLVPPTRLTEGLTWVGTAIGVGFAGGTSLAGEVIERFDAHVGYGVVMGSAFLAAIVIGCGAVVLRRAHLRHSAAALPST